MILVEPQPLEADAAFVPEPVPFEVLDENDQLIVVNKRAGLVVHPGAGNWQGTLMNGLLHQYPELSALPRAGIVHRLDKDTSGLLLVARTEPARQSLIDQLNARTLHRRYVALCHGVLHGAHQFTGPIGRDRSNRLRMTVREDGREALTTVDVIQSGELDQVPVTLVYCRLATGRTHQIRVHLSRAGHPLVGDTVYGGRKLHGFDRQALHAFSVELTQALPVRNHTAGDLGPWLAPLPPDMVQLISAAGLGQSELSTLIARFESAS